jgi:hypothetical protein
MESPELNLEMRLALNVQLFVYSAEHYIRQDAKHQE